MFFKSRGQKRTNSLYDQCSTPTMSSLEKEQPIPKEQSNRELYTCMRQPRRSAQALTSPQYASVSFAAVHER